ncbi:hypothetical protein F0249_19140 [Vibrio sp. 03-59-1]|uniref:hypothetical protein n=1 Tax=Vibrio sp. 03-59-1 TaxID=2607607 RepID=UPI0014934A69|nr:hypothetical protein [Vibrio sp. 03-59-1]NOH85905.1 hypothetical protein [Vibrio sp. 03-59-1]
MHYEIITPELITLERCITCLNVAFARINDDERDSAFQSMVDDLMKGAACWYHVTGDNIDVHVITRVTNDNELFIDAIAGKGMMIVGADIIQKSMRMGYLSIGYETVIPAMRRMLARLGFECVKAYPTGDTIHKLILARTYVE